MTMMINKQNLTQWEMGTLSSEVWKSVHDFRLAVVHRTTKQPICTQP